MWHFNHKSPKASKFARQLLFAVKASGKKVFPDFNTVWHFDDKIAQKYLFESLNLPCVNTYVYYGETQALQWAATTSYPKVFKLRNGAGSDNVRLVANKRQAIQLVKQAFGKGFSQYQPVRNLKERFRKLRAGKTTTWDVIKGIIRLVYTTQYSRVTASEKGYVYFQDFVPGNNYDIRVIVIGERAFAIKRLVRENDFRASGSGFILYEKEHFDEDTIRLAFEISGKLNSQCMAYDFVYQNGAPLLLEISYGFAMHGYDDCKGYWDKELNWYEGKFNPYGWMVDLMVT
jgi:glutathione synthase/RimK-type ligase-like ATP-grasp enzyme